MKDFNADSYIDVIRDLERSFAANEIADACEPIARDILANHT